MELNAEQIVAALKRYAVLAQENNEFDTMQEFDAAIDLIESQASDVAAKDKYIEWASEAIIELRKQLAESRRRERAAVEALNTAASGRCCQICAQDCIGHEEITACTSFEWRGLHEAEKGEADG